MAGTAFSDYLAGFGGRDTLVGADAADTLDGGADADLLAGDHGADMLNGGEGDDTLRGGTGTDLLVGGAGYDVAAYDLAASPVALSLQSGYGWAGDAAGDVLSAIESVLGSRFADVLTGSDDHNIIEGGEDADTVSGLDGNDWASFEHAAGAVAVNLDTGTGWAGDALNDRITGIENLRGSAFADYLFGDSGANILRGDEGADVLYGAGNSDTIYYSTSPAAVRVDLSTNSASGGHAEGDTLVSIENVFATAHADVLVGDSASNTLVGWLGLDVLTGNGGNDIFRWSSAAESGIGPGERDIVTDFWQVHGDLLDLAGMDADAAQPGDQAFAFVGSAVFTAAGQLRSVILGGATVIEANLDADLAPDFAIQLNGAIALLPADFIL